MINEIYLQNAVNIRRTYLKLSSNMDIYQRKAESISLKLDDTISKIDVLQGKAEDSRNNKNGNDTNFYLTELMKILNEVEEDGISLENLVNPLNMEIEKLALEEQELYRQIKEKHYDLSDDEIIKEVQDRLIKENL